MFLIAQAAKSIQSIFPNAFSIQLWGKQISIQHFSPVFEPFFFHIIWSHPQKWHWGNNLLQGKESGESSPISNSY